MNLLYFFITSFVYFQILFFLINFVIVNSINVGSLSWNNKNNDHIYMSDDQNLWLLLPFKFDNVHSQSQFKKVSCQLNNKVSIPNFIESDSLTFGSNRKIEVRLDELGCTWIKVSFQLFSFKTLPESEKVDLLQYHVIPHNSSQIVANGDVIWNNSYSLIYLRKDGVLLIESPHNQIYFTNKFYSAIKHLPFDD